LRLADSPKVRLDPSQEGGTRRLRRGPKPASRRRELEGQGDLVDAILASVQAATRPQDAERGWDRTGSHEAPKCRPTCSFDAFPQVSGLGLGALIIRRSLVRVQPAPHQNRRSWDQSILSSRNRTSRSEPRAVAQGSARREWPRWNRGVRLMAAAPAPRVREGSSRAHHRRDPKLTQSR
jgi:hypothetical protein